MYLVCASDCILCRYFRSSVMKLRKILSLLVYLVCGLFIYVVYDASRTPYLPTNVLQAQTQSVSSCARSTLSETHVSTRNAARIQFTMDQFWNRRPVSLISFERAWQCWINARCESHECDLSEDSDRNRCLNRRNRSRRTVISNLKSRDGRIRARFHRSCRERQFKNRQTVYLKKMERRGYVELGRGVWHLRDLSSSSNG